MTAPVGTPPLYPHAAVSRSTLSAGLTQGTETIGLLVLICLWPGPFAVLAWAFGGTCWLTTASRVAAAVRAFRGQKRGDRGVGPRG